MLLTTYLKGLVAEGKIRAYGWSTDNPDGALVFSEGEHCIAVQHNLTVVTDAPEMTRLCEEKQLASINRSPLGRGLLTGKYTAASTFPDNDIRSGDSFTDQWAKPILENLEAVREVLTSGGCTLAQGALRWIWAYSDATVPIPGFRNIWQLEENIGALVHGPLSRKEMDQIDQLLSR